MKYGDKLKDPRWQKKRLEILDDRGWACELCCDKKSPLHVHHTSYDSGVAPWDYENCRLRVLCESCHEHEHTKVKELLDDIIDLKIRKHGALFYEVAWLIASDLRLVEPDAQD